MCITPITLKRDYRTLSGEFTKVVPCGQCVKCLRRRQSAWAFRLYKEMEVSSSACFLTLTYEKCPVSPFGLPTLSKRDFQLFMKKLRKACPNRKIKYYACGEYGSRTLRPHYHAIMFNLPRGYIETAEKMAAVWGHGIVDIGDCNLASIRYTTKYVMKGKWIPEDYVDETTGELYQDDRLREFSLMSKGLGLNYLTEKMIRYHKNRMVDYATLEGGVIVPLPRYFKERLFSKAERKMFSELHAVQRELDFEKIYRNAEHEVLWKKDLIRKSEKEVLTRNSI